MLAIGCLYYINTAFMPSLLTSVFIMNSLEKFGRAKTGVDVMETLSFSKAL